MSGKMAGSATYGSTFKTTLASADGPVAKAKKQLQSNKWPSFQPPLECVHAGINSSQRSCLPLYFSTGIGLSRSGEFLMRIGRRNLISGAALRSGTVPARSTTRCDSSTVSRSLTIG